MVLIRRSAPWLMTEQLVHYTFIRVVTPVSAIIGNSIVCAKVCSGQEYKKYQSSALMALCLGCDQWVLAQRAKDAEGFSNVNSMLYGRITKSKTLIPYNVVSYSYLSTVTYNIHDDVIK